MNGKEIYEQRYELLCELYGVNSSAWDMIHVPSKYMIDHVFCPSNQKSLIAEYLEWEDFVVKAKEYGVPYYIHIDTFLKKFHDLVYSKLHIDEKPAE